MWLRHVELIRHRNSMWLCLSLKGTSVPLLFTTILLDLILAATATIGAYLHGYWLGLYSLTVLSLGYCVDGCLGMAPEHEDCHCPG
jgi:hypothetical protein